MMQFLVNIACDELEADTIRDFARKQFRQLHLKCRTERTYPVSGWSTPSFGVAIWVYVTVSVPQGQVLSSKVLRQIAAEFENSLKDSFQSIQDFSIDFGKE